MESRESFTVVPLMVQTKAPLPMLPLKPARLGRACYQTCRGNAIPFGLRLEVDEETVGLLRRKPSCWCLAATATPVQLRLEVELHDPGLRLEVDEETVGHLQRGPTCCRCLAAAVTMVQQRREVELRRPWYSKERG